jgi:hypothetical protein
MFKRTLLMMALVGTFSFAVAADANAWIVRRGRPVRRVVAHTVLPPYPVARRVVAGPVYRYPVVYGSAYYGTPSIYATPSVYVGPGVYVGF